MQEKDNPYFDLSIVRRREMFFGRTDLLYTIFMICLNQQCISLVGTRKSGKSSILAFLQTPELQQPMGFYEKLRQCLFIYVDMHYAIQRSPDEFFRMVNLLIVERAPHDLVSQIGPIEQMSGRQHDHFNNLLRALRAVGYHTVLLMDSFDKLEKETQLGPSFFSFLRAPATQGLISYVTASLKPLNMIVLSQADSPFFSGFKTDMVGSLSKEEATQLITVPASQAGCAFTLDEVGWLLEQAGRHPFFLQRACSILYKEKSKLDNEDGINRHKVQQDIYKELMPHFRSIWSDLMPDEQRDLRYEARQADRTSRKMEELSESFLFRRYICELPQTEQAVLTWKDLKTMVEHLNDHAFLQECALSSMQYIITREDGTKNMRYQRGSLVQDFLKAAFELSKPPGVHSDTLNEWRSYNILYYRYFRHQMAHETIAARLGISRRQYFRDLEKAFQTLLERLLELDRESFA